MAKKKTAPQAWAGQRAAAAGAAVELPGLPPIPKPKKRRTKKAGRR